MQLNSKRKWQLLCYGSFTGNKTVPSLSQYSEILIIFGYSQASQCQETSLVPMEYFETGKPVLMRDAINGQGINVQYVNDTTIAAGSLSDNRWGIRMYAR